MNDTLIIANAQVLTPDGLLPGSVEVANGRIVAITSLSALLPTNGARIVEARGQLLVPGFIDLQVNGGFGLDFTADPSTIWEVAAGLPRFGVTSFLPTIITSPLATIRQAQHVLAAGVPAEFKGAQPLGLHLEGPFLNPAKKGAHQTAYLQTPTVAAVEDWSPARSIRLVTLAPELPGALDVVTRLTARGVVVSAGHSMASLAVATSAFDAGVRYGTHLFNAMLPLHQREPGLVGALLTDERTTIGLIADGVHVHPRWLHLVWAVAARRLTVVTDGMAAMGLGDGRYYLGDRVVTVTDGRATVADGTLAGSTMTLDAALRLLATATGATLTDVVSTVTTTPARLLGLVDHGRIVPGCAADLVLLSDGGDVVLTIKAGQIVYASENAKQHGQC